VSKAVSFTTDHDYLFCPRWTGTGFAPHLPSKIGDSATNAVASYRGREFH